MLLNVPALSESSPLKVLLLAVSPCQVVALAKVLLVPDLSLIALLDLLLLGTVGGMEYGVTDANVNRKAPGLAELLTALEMASGSRQPAIPTLPAIVLGMRRMSVSRKAILDIDVQKACETIVT